MKPILISLFLLTGGAGWLAAQAEDAPKTKEKAGTASERYEALVKEFETAREDYSKAYSKAKTDAAREKLQWPQAETYAPRFFALARENPQDSAALDALVWVAANCRESESRDTSLKLLLKDHAKSPRMAQVARSLVYTERKTAEPWLRSLLKEATEHEIGRAHV